MVRAVELAREAGCYKVNLISGNARTGAHDFYRSLGFEPSARASRPTCPRARSAETPGPAPPGPARPERFASRRVVRGHRRLTPAAQVRPAVSRRPSERSRLTSYIGGLLSRAASLTSGRRTRAPDTALIRPRARSRPRRRRRRQGRPGACGRLVHIRTEDQELVAAEPADEAAGANARAQVARDGAQSSSPAAWPCSSLTSLKPSRSMKAAPARGRARRRRCSARARG